MFLTSTPKNALGISTLHFTLIINTAVTWLKYCVIGYGVKPKTINQSFIINKSFKICLSGLWFCEWLFRGNPGTMGPQYPFLEYGVVLRTRSQKTKASHQVWKNKKRP